ncbi:MAG: S9 family peptidase [Myxococcota bacterium]
MTPEEYVRLPRVSAAVCSPDGNWLAVCVARLDNVEGQLISDLWRVPLDGGAPSRLLDGDDDDTAPAFDAEGALLFLSNRPLSDVEEDEDDKRKQVWRLGLDGALSPVTDEPLGVEAFAIGGRRILLKVKQVPGVDDGAQRSRAKDRKKNGPTALHYTRLPVRHWNHWRGEAVERLVLIDGTERRELTPEVTGELRQCPVEISADGRVAVTIAVFPSRSDRLFDARIWVFDLDAGERRVVGVAPRVGWSSPRISADGSTLVCVQNRRMDGAHGPAPLWRFDLHEGDVDGQALTDGEAIWLTPGAWLDADTLLCLARHQARQSVFSVKVRTGDVVQETAAGSWDRLQVCRDVVAAVHSDLLHPPQPATIIGGVIERRPLVEEPAFDVEVEEHRVPSDDGVDVQGWVLRPRSVDASPLPGLFVVHGGPIGHWADVWHWRWNAALMAEQGYIVALPNPRGSIGFGQEFVEGVWGNQWGGQCFRDLMAWADFFDARPDVDAENVAAMGASFGGFMMNWFGVSTDRFSALICHAGIFSPRTFQGITDYPDWWAHQMGIDPYDDAEAYQTYSPMAHLPAWKTPTLIIHGEKDYRCTVDQALGLFSALQSRDVPSELLIFPDEGHWIMRPRNVVAWYATVFDYLTRRREIASG